MSAKIKPLQIRTRLTTVSSNWSKKHLTTCRLLYIYESCFFLNKRILKFNVGVFNYVIRNLLKNMEKFCTTSFLKQNFSWKWFNSQLINIILTSYFYSNKTSHEYVRKNAYIMLVFWKACDLKTRATQNNKEKTFWIKNKPQKLIRIDLPLLRSQDRWRKNCCKCWILAKYRQFIYTCVANLPFDSQNDNVHRFPAQKYILSI